VVSESLLDALLAAPAAPDPLSLPLGDTDRKLLAAALMQEDEELLPELVDGAIEALRRRQLERRQRQIQMEIAEAEKRKDVAVLGQLVQEKLQVDRALAGVSHPQ
jgi:hypothetical protein